MQARTIHSRFGTSVLLGALTLGLAAPTLARPNPAGPMQEASGRFVRAGSSGARVLNFPDKRGDAVRKMSAGELLRVWNENYGFYEVEAPGGLQVWVFGQFIQPTAEDGVLRVTGSSVNMRPKPSGLANDNMPLQTKLTRGDRVVMIERKDASLPLAEDWIRVWSPETARGWVAVGDVQQVDDAGAAAEEWARASALVRRPAAERAPARSSATGEVAEAAAPLAAATPGATTSLAEADALFEAERSKAVPDYAPVVAAYQAVLASAAAGSTTAQIAEVGLRKAELQLELSRAESTIRAEEERRAAQLEQVRMEQQKAAQRRDPLWGRFSARGWLERETIKGTNGAEDTYVYTVHWSGSPTAEVICSSGRYDLDPFVGFEVGINGLVARPTIAASEDSAALLRVIDVSRMEVISGSAVRR